jgi:hypothetical protein
MESSNTQCEPRIKHDSDYYPGNSAPCDTYMEMLRGAFDPLAMEQQMGRFAIISMSDKVAERVRMSEEASVAIGWCCSAADVTRPPHPERL